MRVAAFVLFLLATACAGFAYWGMNTVDGRIAINEMPTALPGLAMVVSAVAALLAVFLGWRSTRRRARSRSRGRRFRRLL